MLIHSLDEEDLVDDVVMIDDDNVGVADVSLGVGSSQFSLSSTEGVKSQDTNPGLFDFNPAQSRNRQKPTEETPFDSKVIGSVQKETH